MKKYIDKFSNKQLINIYKEMLTIRKFEDSVYYLFLQNILPGTVHQSQGQEAVSVGVCKALKKGDFIASNHRCHGHSLAKGMSIDSAMAEFFAKRSGCCGGRGGSMHLSSKENGILPAIAVVGEQIVIGIGVGLALKKKHTNNLIVIFFGDGAVNTGAFHEGVNMASLFKLPVIFVCENNQYAASTSFKSMSPVENVSDRASAYNIIGKTINGMDPLEVYENVIEAAKRARRGHGPTLLECKTYRLRGHSRTDPQQYKSKEEIESWKSKDPIKNFREKLILADILDEKKCNTIEKDIENKINEAINKSKNDLIPDIKEATKHVY